MMSGNTAVRWVTGKSQHWVNDIQSILMANAINFSRLNYVIVSVHSWKLSTFKARAFHVTAPAPGKGISHDSRGSTIDCTNLVLLLLVQLFQCQTAFLVLAPLVLEPHSDHPRTQSSHLDQLFLHQSIRTGIGRVARPEHVQLLLIQDGPYPGCLVVMVSTGPAAAMMVPSGRSIASAAVVVMMVERSVVMRSVAVWSGSTSGRRSDAVLVKGTVME
jgi:hypothetical protein